jgi:4,4'-diaponeurosporenoate glycosyltransferase
MFEPLLWIALVGWLAGLAVLFRIPRVPGSLPGPSPWPVSIIVPARDEERNIGTLLESLRSQSLPPLEVIVVDDGSKDRTAEIARSLGARVVQGKPLPSGWTGKNWALAQGVQASRGDVFLFLDADTFLEAGALKALAGASASRPGVHSVCPYHAVRKPYEQLSAYFNLLMAAGSNAFTLLGRRAGSIGLFGQALLVSRKDYEAVGGHEAVKDQILENYFLAREFAREGIPTCVYAGRGTVRMRMFPDGAAGMVSSWSKAFAKGAAATPKATFFGTVVWLTGAVCAATAVTASPAFPAVLPVYGLFALQLYWMLRRIGSFHPLTAILFPVPLFFFFAVFLNSVLVASGRKSARWKGRDAVGHP